VDGHGDRRGPAGAQRVRRDLDADDAQVGERRGPGGSLLASGLLSLLRSGQAWRGFRLPDLDLFVRAGRRSRYRRPEPDGRPQRRADGGPRRPAAAWRPPRDQRCGREGTSTVAGGSGPIPGW
jgi:hypothetical protein